MRLITVLSKIYEDKNSKEPKLYILSVKFKDLPESKIELTKKQLKTLCLNPTNVVINAFVDSKSDELMFIDENNISIEYIERTELVESNSTVQSELTENKYDNEYLNNAQEQENNNQQTHNLSGVTSLSFGEGDQDNKSLSILSENMFEHIEIGQECYYECDDKLQNLYESLSHFSKNMSQDCGMITLPKVLIKGADLNGYKAILIPHTSGTRLNYSVLSQLLNDIKEYILTKGNHKLTTFFNKETEYKPFSDIYIINYVKPKDCTVNYRNTFEGLFTKPIGKCTATQSESYSLFDGKLRALVGMNFGKKVIEKKSV